MATTVTPPAPAPAADMEMDTGGDEVQRGTRVDGVLSKFEFDGETEEVKLAAEEKLLLREACKKTKPGLPHLEETAADVAPPRTQMDGTAAT